MTIDICNLYKVQRLGLIMLSISDCSRHSREKGFFYEASKGKAVDEELGRQDSNMFNFN